MVSAGPAGEGAAAQGDTLFALSARFPLRLLRGRSGERQPEEQPGQPAAGDVEKGSGSKS